MVHLMEWLDFPKPTNSLTQPMQTLYSINRVLKEKSSNVYLNLGCGHGYLVM